MSSRFGLPPRAVGLRRGRVLRLRVRRRSIGGRAAIGLRARRWRRVRRGRRRRCGRRGRTAEPGDEIVGVGVRREGVGDDDLRADRDVAAEHLHRRNVVGQESSPCAFGLVAREDHGVARVGEQACEVVQHASTGCHARRRDDDRREAQPVERLRFSACAGLVQRAGRRARRRRRCWRVRRRRRRRSPAGRPGAPRAPSGCRRRRADPVSVPSSTSSRRASRTISVRSTANAGMTTMPPRFAVRVIASAMRSTSSSCDSCSRSP